jgi:hypothetical protein
MEATDSDKHSSLLWYEGIYGCKWLYDADPGFLNPLHEYQNIICLTTREEKKTFGIEEKKTGPWTISETG